ncbi:M56 family metallopeptidase [Altererythrobacter sp. MF3-039]|uniref:M56 family metallopeptidase n=1 Tax=Altererythrobacter sp. MF3-039 TaxID=3252901 RepID=UPI00390C55FF
MSWLLDTLVWTGALIALVLLLRRPVAQHFGATAAYALWLLPMARLVLPPFILPASMAPAQSEPVAVEVAAGAEAMEIVIPVAPAGGVPAASVQTSEASWIVSLDWGLIATIIWIAGAITFVALRVRAYHRMRSVLLTNAVNVGEAGAVRLVETPLTEAPIAFGVRDKVIALPEGFLDQPDVAARNLALEHELAHHRGNDLLINFAVQPLFALHWFNPLAWLGWRALRCDQEAACDARVVSERSRQERAHYAEVIASFATGPKLTLAAPMACPVIGDKSIIHRLRSLTMNDVSPRRRKAGKFGLAAAALAIPLTATVTYAEVLAPETAQEAPPAPEAPLAPSTTLAPSAPLAPAAPMAPLAPEAPMAPLAPMAMQAVGEAAEEGEKKERRVYVIKSEEHKSGGDGHADHKVHKVHKVKVHASAGEKMSPEERARMKAEVAEAMAEMKIELAEAREAHKIAMIEMKDSMGEMVTIEANCESSEPLSEKLAKNGKKVMVVCETAVMGQAREALKQARASIAAQSDMDAEIRATVLEALDEEIRNFDNEG